MAYIRSNLWSRLDQASAMEVVLESMQMALVEVVVVEMVSHLATLARSPPGTTVGGW